MDITTTGPSEEPLDLKEPASENPEVPRRTTSERSTSRVSACTAFSTAITASDLLDHLDILPRVVVVVILILVVVVVVVVILALFIIIPVFLLVLVVFVGVIVLVIILE